ncbi:metal dependent phosphohydrolase [Methanoregula boonei 6A8]|jgi:HD superfamily phosphohydrolase|uniref:Metal dependent phosphohydrolase n=1 Tax=Methanoregula boonei (strain DSM 21154 / JCM 14090 / 6A8) TaxID=456442 RepID=A7I5T2_METB6|nr:HD domain-containing protein [Methanoregula boonei]ABS55093.1 metal dependent phosphohydrolase [Methanoregula boonei 6A8]
MTLLDEVNTLVNKTYNSIAVPNIIESKVVHFAKTGTHQFENYEIAIIDTPIVQRLRYISQLGLAYSVFPTARHTRFEHSLGVSIMVDKMFKSLEENHQLEHIRDRNIRKNNYIELRIAGLLHDIGHGPFSHVSEIIMSEYEPIEKEAIKEGCKPHELLAYKMLQTEKFQNFFAELNKHYKIDISPSNIANYIIGKVDNPKDDQYLADLINGQCDADKLDYIARDSNFTGVKLALGIDRLLLSLGVDKISCFDGMKRKLIVNEKGLMPLEQILIAKIMLNYSIYLHQKVRAIDYMIIPLLRKIVREKKEISGHTIKSPLDFLLIDDYDILNFASSDTETSNLCKSIKMRKIFKRSLVISPKTIDRKRTDNFQDLFLDLIKYSEKPQDMLNLNQNLIERIGENCTQFDVAIDLPKTPKLGELDQKIIKLHDGFVAVSEDIKTGWLESYLANKWKGHIFSNEKYRQRAQDKGIELFEEEFGLKFNEFATKDAKITFEYKKDSRDLSDFGIGL